MIKTTHLSPIRRLIGLRYPSDLGQFTRALTAPFVLLIPFAWTPENPWVLAGFWFVIWLSIAKLNYVLHNHIHVPFTTRKWLNWWIDWSLGFTTGMTAGNWRLTHVHAHHAAHIQDKLPSRKVYFDFQQHQRTYTVFGAVLHCLTSSGPQFLVPLKDSWHRGFASPRGFRTAYYRYVIYEALGVYGFAGLLFAINPEVAVLFLLLPYVLVYLISRYIDFVTHTNVDEDSRFGYTVVCVSRAYNRLFWNFGYHLAHHEVPRLHWSELPTYFECMNLEPEKNCVRTEPILLPPFISRWQRYKLAG